LLGFFVKDLMAEVKVKGWHTPRAVVNMFMFLVRFVCPPWIGPAWHLGLYPPAPLKLLEWCLILSILQCFAITGYMYIIALYKRNMSPVPPFLRNNWLIFNIGCSLVHIALVVAGAIVGNLFWFGVDGRPGGA